jgi:DNA anti-recombination protein RmuC
MRSSRGEICIEEILEEAGLPFKMEYSFPELTSSSGRPLRFDFVVFDDDGKIDFIIEYQGR